MANERLKDWSASIAVTCALVNRSRDGTTNCESRLLRDCFSSKKDRDLNQGLMKPQANHDTHAGQKVGGRDDWIGWTKFRKRRNFVETSRTQKSLIKEKKAENLEEKFWLEVERVQARD